MANINNTKPFYNSLIPNDWEVKHFEDVAEIDKESLNGNTPKDYEFDYISLSDVDSGDLIIETTKQIFAAAPSRARRIVKKGDVLMSTVRPNLQGFFLVRDDVKDLIASTGFAVITAKKCSNEFLYQYLFSSGINRQFYQLLVGSNYPAINSSDVRKLKIPLPPLPEQNAIAYILSTWDNAIAKTQKLIVQLQLRNKGLGQKLFLGETRIKKFVESDQRHKTSLGELPVDWKLNSIKDILRPIKKSFTPQKNELYQQIGIRSHTKGIFYKEKVTGKALGGKSVFWIEPDCFIVNIVFAWEHAIAKTTGKEIGMIASHRFPMYEPKAGVLDLDYLLCYFKSPRGKHLLGLASPGGAGRNKTLGQSEFAKLQIPVPSLQEQIAIATLLNTAEREIELLKMKLELLKEQKKGLMQVLLTGKKRVKSNKQYESYRNTN